MAFRWPASGAVNFWVTNRLIPRRALTRAFGWFSRIEHPLVARASIGAWRMFSNGLDLDEARKRRFSSLHECFIRELADGARVVDRDPGVVTSPCDAMIVACGRVRDDLLIQAKAVSYTVSELLGEAPASPAYRDGVYATLRLTATMYHRFHAPHDCRIERVRHIAGDLWNVNPPALERVPRLYCRNERVVIPVQMQPLGVTATLVAVGAVLVGSIRLNFVDTVLNNRYTGPAEIECGASFEKGEELGFFQHGSTIVVLAPSSCTLDAAIRTGGIVRMGQPLMRGPSTPR